MAAPSGLSDAFSAVRDLKALPDAERRAALQDIAASTHAPVELLEGLLTLPEEQLQRVTEAAMSIADAVGGSYTAGGASGGASGAVSQASALASIPPDALVELTTTFKALPASARRAAMTMVPEQVRPVAVAAQFMEPAAIGELTSKLPQLAAAVEVVMGDDDGAAASAERGDAGGAAAAKDKRAARVAAAAELHRTFKSLPPRAREELSRLAPPQLAPAVQLAEGLEEDDIPAILSELDKHSGNASTTKGGPSSDKGDDGAAAAGHEGDAEARPSSEEEQRQAAKAAARLAARAEARRLWRWVRGSPCGLRVLNFLGGLALSFAGVTGIVIQTFNEFRIWMIILQFYICVFGLLMASLEVDSALCVKYVSSNVQKWLGFLTTSSGRGHYLLFVGFLTLSIWDPTTHGWTELFDIPAAFFVLGLALLNYVAGCTANGKLKAARARVADVEELTRRFEEADVAMHGALAPDDIVALLNDLDPPVILSTSELRAAVLQLDTNRDGHIQLDELVHWYSARQDEDSAPISFKWKLATGGPASLRVLSFAAGLFYATSGAIGIVTEILDRSHDTDNRDTFILHAILDVYIVLLGLFVAALESRVTTCGGTNVTLAVARQARLFNRVWGRGFFYQFLGFVALSQWSTAEIVNIVSGFTMLGVGVVNVVVGAFAARALHGVGSVSRKAAEEQFRAADADGNGVLDVGELSTLLDGLGVRLTRPQLEAAFVEIDVDGSGEIALNEWIVWTQGDAASSFAEAVAASEEHDDEMATQKTPLLR